MSRSDEQRLDDIREMCAKVEELVGRGRDALDVDDLLWLAMERAVEIAGEAAGAVSTGTRAQYPEVDWRGLTGIRVKLAHHYHRVDRDTLWITAEEDLPIVSQALGPILEIDPELPE